MIRLLHLADVHLGAPLRGFGRLAEERRGQVLDAFRRLPELAEETGAGAVLIAGDLFDGPRPTDPTLAAVRETTRRLLDAGVGVFAVPGNHDAINLHPSLYEEALADAVVFRRPAFGAPARATLGDETLCVYGVAHDPAEEADPLGTFRKADDEGLHVVLLHGSVPGAPHWEGGTSLKLPPERLAELDVDYIALGDYHRFRPPSEFDTIPACYAGSFAAVDTSESGRKGPVLVELAGGEPPQVRQMAAGVPEVTRLEGFDVTRFSDEVAVAEAIGERLPAEAVPVIQLTGEPGFPLDPERVRVRLEERFGFAALRDETRYYDSARLAELAEQKTIAGHVARLGLQRIREAESAGGRRIAERGLRTALRQMGVA